MYLKKISVSVIWFYRVFSKNIQHLETFCTLHRGVPRIWQGGAKNFFVRFGNLHAAHGEAMRFARGVRGHAPREIFLRLCNLVCFGVYLDQI